MVPFLAVAALAPSLSFAGFDAPLTAVARPVLSKNGAPVLHRPDIGVTWEVVDVEVTNRTTKALTLASYPTRVKDDWQDKNGGGSGDGGPSKVSASPNAFTLVAAKRSLHFRIYVPLEMMAPHAKPHLTLVYQGNVGPRNKDAWLGEIVAKVITNSK